MNYIIHPKYFPDHKLPIALVDNRWHTNPVRMGVARITKLWFILVCNECTTARFDRKQGYSAGAFKDRMSLRPSKIINFQELNTFATIYMATPGIRAGRRARNSSRRANYLCGMGEVQMKTKTRELKAQVNIRLSGEGCRRLESIAQRFGKLVTGRPFTQAEVIERALIVLEDHFETETAKKRIPGNPVKSS